VSGSGVIGSAAINRDGSLTGTFTVRGTAGQSVQVKVTAGTACPSSGPPIYLQATATFTFNSPTPLPSPTPRPTLAPTSTPTPTATLPPPPTPMPTATVPPPPTATSVAELQLTSTTTAEPTIAPAPAATVEPVATIAPTATPAAESTLTPPPPATETAVALPAAQPAATPAEMTVPPVIPSTSPTETRAPTSTPTSSPAGPPKQVATSAAATVNFVGCTASSGKVQARFDPVHADPGTSSFTVPAVQLTGRPGTFALDVSAAQAGTVYKVIAVTDDPSCGAGASKGPQAYWLGGRELDISFVIAGKTELLTNHYGTVNTDLPWEKQVSITGYESAKKVPFQITTERQRLWRRELTVVHDALYPASHRPGWLEPSSRRPRIGGYPSCGSSGAVVLCQPQSVASGERRALSWEPAWPRPGSLR